MDAVVRIKQRIDVAEVAHIEATINKLRHMAIIAHKVGCEEVKTCHPMLGQLIRDYLMATTTQLNSLLEATGMVNQMFRTILEQAGEDDEQGN